MRRTWTLVLIVSLAGAALGFLVLPTAVALGLAGVAAISAAIAWDYLRRL